MHQCISYWSLKHGLANEHPIGDALRETKQAGYDGLELSIGPAGELTVETDQAACQKVRQQIDQAGLVVETAASGMAWGANPASDDPDVRRTAIEQHKAALERTAWLGCEAMLYIPGVVVSPIAPNECVRYDQAVERAREGVKELLETAERVNVDLCLENVWNGLFLNPLELADFVDSFKSDRLGVYLDVGNLLRYHQHPPHWIELLGKRVKRVHLKDFDESFDFKGSYAFAELLEGQVPWEQTMASLRKIGYDRTLVAEMLPWSEGLLDRTKKAMEKIVAMG